MKKLLIYALIALFCVSAAACSKTPSTSVAPSIAGSVPPSVTGSTPSAPPEYPAAPDFSMLNFNGESVRLSHYFGKPIVLNFWASWCPPCKAELPDFNDVYLDLQGEVVFLMVNLTDGARETVDTAKSFLASTDYQFPVFFDTTFAAYTRYGVQSIPTTFFINGEGKVVTYASGKISESILRSAIEKIR